MRRFLITLLWSAVSSVLGCLFLGLVHDGVGAASLVSAIADGARFGGPLIVVLSVFSVACGALIGDLPGLRWSWPREYLAWVEADLDRRQFSFPSRRVVLLSLPCFALILLVIVLWPVPDWLALLAMVVASSRAVSLGKHLDRQQRYREQTASPSAEDSATR